MANHFSHQPYGYYGQPHWNSDTKPAYVESDDSSVLDDKVFDEQSPAQLTPVSDIHPSTSVKQEEDYSMPDSLWQDPSISQMRHHSYPILHESSRPHPMRPGNFADSYTQSPPWNWSATPNSNTPTPVFASVNDVYTGSGQFTGGPVNFGSYSAQEPTSAVSVSPQSSQGGWNSTNETSETRNQICSPSFRAASPNMVMRPDGIRKKNARFEIPKERNLANIDAMIMASTDEAEKKELKQQKRLLRNRQAALDSRHRKKSHTEKLEQEKKMFHAQKSELEENLGQLETALAQERQLRMQMEAHINELSRERDAAIQRQATVETDLRTQNNFLKDHVKTLEKQLSAQDFNPAAIDDNIFSSYSSNYHMSGLDNSWENFPSGLDRDEFNMEHEYLQRQATPRPPMPQPQSTESKPDTGFGWNTFYFCLLIGAFLASKSTDVSSTAAVPTDLKPAMPPLSEEYRTEAGNVLKAVLASNPDSASAQPIRSGAFNSPGTSLSASNKPGLSHGVNPGPSSIEYLHSSLTTPSREQQMRASFSLSASSYNSLVTGDGRFNQEELTDTAPAHPSRIEELYASLQAERNEMEKRPGLGSKARERSLLLERVPEKALRDFHEMVILNEQLQQQDQQK